MRIYISVPHREKNETGEPPEQAVAVIAKELRRFRVAFLVIAPHLIILIGRAESQAGLDSEDKQGFDIFRIIELAPPGKSERTQHRAGGTFPFNQQCVRWSAMNRGNDSPQRHRQETTCQAASQTIHGTKAMHSTSTNALLGRAATSTALRAGGFSPKKRA